MFTARPARAPAQSARPASPPASRRAPLHEPLPKRAPPSLGRQATPPNATKIFGSPPLADVATNRDDATLVAHRPQARGSEADASSNATMIFGSPALPPADDSKRSTRAGAFNETREDVSDSSRTIVFGAPSRPASEPTRSPAKTAMFGAVAAPRREELAPVAKPQSPAPESAERERAEPEPELAASSRTMIFGGTTPPESSPAPEPELAASSRTMIFGGTTPAESSPAPAPEDPMAGGSDRTLLFGKSQLAATPSPEGQPHPSRPPPRGTQMFGAAQPGAKDDDAADAASIASSGAPAVEIPAVPLPDRRPASRPPGEEEVVAQTELVGETPAEATPAIGAELEGADAPLSQDSNAGDEPMPGPAPGAVWSKRSQGAAPPASMKAGAQTLQLQLALKKSQRRLPMILGGVAVGLLVVLGATAFFTLRTPKVDPATLAADAAALNLMKRDDSASLKQAIAAWQDIEAKDPKYLPAQANSIMAYTLLTHDLGEEIRRLRAKGDQARGELEKGAAEKREELVKLNAQMDRLIDEARKYDEAASKLLVRCKEAASGSPDSAAVFRASAVYFGVKGNKSAERLAKIYSDNPKDERGVLHDDARAFADLALAAFYAQQSAPEAREKAKEALRKDPALTRARLIQAKLMLEARDFAGARKAIGEIVKANPAHLAAAHLIQDIESATAHSEPAP